MINNFANNLRYTCELFADGANNLGFFRKLPIKAFPYSAAEFSVSGCGKLDALGCLPYPHPLIIRVIFQKRE
jgi:hypothetical protein